jgi:hypothetical protein
LYLVLSSFIAGSKRNYKTEVVQSTAALNTVDKGHNFVGVIQFPQHEPSTLLSFVSGSSLLKVFSVVEKHNVV